MKTAGYMIGFYLLTVGVAELVSDSSTGSVPFVDSIVGLPSVGSFFPGNSGPYDTAIGLAVLGAVYWFL